MSEIVSFSGQARDTDAAEAAARAFIMAVGTRVRRMRQSRGLSRRILSELSGVSQRYLAQLEGGDGNISIALLHRVAGALDCRVEWLVGTGQPAHSDAALFAALFAKATAQQRAQIMRLLNTAPVQAPSARRICLIGLRGAGKSTLGRLLGEALSLPFIELNQGIEEQGGMAVDEVMALYGQEGYRRLERRALEQVIETRDAVVLAAAGGIVSDQDTYRLLLEHFQTIWLKAMPHEHMSRVRAQGDERPMAGNSRAMEELNAILASREALYARADVTVDTSARSVDDILQELLDLVQLS